MDQIGHHHAAFHFLKMMLVVPHGIRTKALLVHKKLFGNNMGNLGHPKHRNAKHRPYIVGHHLPGIHFITIRVHW